MGIAWGLSQYSSSFRERDQELRGRGLRPIQARVALARHACRLCYALLTPSSPSTKRAIVWPGTVAGGDGLVSYAARRRNLACRPPALATLTAHTKACRTDGASSACRSGHPGNHHAPPKTRPAPPASLSLPRLTLDSAGES